MRGHELRRLGRTAEAIDEFRKAGELEDAYYKTENIPALYDWHRAHNLALLALCYETLGQMNAAETPLKEMFSLPARTDIAEFNRREWPDFLLDTGHPEEALKAARVMISNSHWPMGKLAGYAAAGRAYLAMNRIDDAKAELDAAEREMENVPSSTIGQLPNASILRAEIALSMHKFEGADEPLKRSKRHFGPCLALIRGANRFLNSSRSRALLNRQPIGRWSNTRATKSLNTTRATRGVTTLLGWWPSTEATTRSRRASFKRPGSCGPAPTRICPNWLPCEESFRLRTDFVEIELCRKSLAVAKKCGLDRSVSYWANRLRGAAYD